MADAVFADIGSFPQIRVRRGIPGGSRFVVPWRGRGATGRLTRRVRNPLMNQNLLYLVFKCLLNTKHSGSGRWPQVLFHAQQRCGKRTRKTGRWRPPPGICNDNPPLVHRVAHYNRRRRTVDTRCAFATARGTCCGATKKPDRRQGKRGSVLRLVIPTVPTARPPAYPPAHPQAVARDFLSRVRERAGVRARAASGRRQSGAGSARPTTCCNLPSGASARGPSGASVTRTLDSPCCAR